MKIFTSPIKHLSKIWNRQKHWSNAVPIFRSNLFRRNYTVVHLFLIKYNGNS